jgi:hypothetical protein
MDKIQSDADSLWRVMEKRRIACIQWLLLPEFTNKSWQTNVDNLAIMQYKILQIQNFIIDKTFEE